MTNPNELTPASLELFLKFARDAANWSGTPLIGGNFDFTKADAGNLTDLKKHGLVTTTRDDDNRLCFWLDFTPAGLELAAAHGLSKEDLGIWR